MNCCCKDYLLSFQKVDNKNVQIIILFDTVYLRTCLKDKCYFFNLRKSENKGKPGKVIDPIIWTTFISRRG